MLFLTALNMNGNHIDNACLQPLASNPTIESVGQVYYNTTSRKLLLFNGESWMPVGANVEASTRNGYIKVDGTDVKVYGLELDTNPGLVVSSEKLKVDPGYTGFTNYYTKAQIDAMKHLDYKVVDVLPTTAISATTIYLVRSSKSESQNVYDEFIYANNLWEKIGTTQTDISNYLKKDGDGSAVTVAFSQPSTPSVPSTGEDLATIVGKLSSVASQVISYGFPTVLTVTIPTGSTSVSATVDKFFGYVAFKGGTQVSIDCTKNVNLYTFSISQATDNPVVVYVLKGV